MSTARGSSSAGIQVTSASDVRQVTSTVFEKCCGFFKVPCIIEVSRGRETRSMALYPHPRLEGSSDRRRKALLMHLQHWDQIHREANVRPISQLHTHPLVNPWYQMLNICSCVRTILLVFNVTFLGVLLHC